MWQAWMSRKFSVVIHLMFYLDKMLLNSSQFLLFFLLFTFTFVFVIFHIVIGEMFMFSQRHNHAHFPPLSIPFRKFNRYVSVFLILLLLFRLCLVPFLYLSISLSVGLTFNSSISEIEMSLSFGGPEYTFKTIYWKILLVFALLTTVAMTHAHSNKFHRTLIAHDGSWLMEFFRNFHSTVRERGEGVRDWQQKKMEQVNQSLIHQSFEARTVNTAHKTLIEFKWTWNI